jgi:putative tricarboxylic transport membrane protein
MIGDVLLGLQNVLLPANAFMMVLGVILGILFGLLPGISGVNGVALLIPFTFTLDPIAGILLLTGVYCGSTYGGSITSILFNTPGDPQNAPTCFDGYPMAKRGEAGRALGLAITSSGLGGIFGTIVLMTVSPILARFALDFSPAEFFALAIFGLSIISGLDSKAPRKGILSGLFGLFLGTVGIDSITGVHRFTFGTQSLVAGVSFITVTVGVFALGEIFSLAHRKEEVSTVDRKVTAELPRLREIVGLRWTLLRSMVLGTFIGVLPGVGATTAAFLGYASEAKFSKKRDQFGSGVPEGIAAPESANNAAVGGSYVPMLTMGIPGSATTAILIGGLIVHGIVPGPLLFIQQKPLVYSVFVGMFLSNIVMIAAGILAIRLFVRVLNVPYPFQAAVVIVLCTIGAFANRNDIADIWIMMGFGILGFFMNRYGFPLAPLVLGVVLGPIAEASLRRAMLMMDQDFWGLFARPISGALLVLSILSLLAPFVKYVAPGMRIRKASVSSNGGGERPS